MVPIGAPYLGLAFFVLDGWLQPVPAGVVGELYVAGAWRWRRICGSGGVDGVAVRGVPVRGAGTSACIAPGIWCAGAPMGSCGIVGRADEQVKIRGYRIELGEVRGGVGRAGRGGAGGGDRPRGSPRRQAPGGLHHRNRRIRSASRAALAQRLPEYMVPSAIVVIDALPLTVNGKLDKRALPAPEYQDTDAVTAPRPRSPRRSWPTSTPRCWL